MQNFQYTFETCKWSLSKLESKEGKSHEQRHVFYHEQNLKTASSRKQAYLHKKILLSSEPMSVSQLIYSVT